MNGTYFSVNGRLVTGLRNLFRPLSDLWQTVSRARRRDGGPEVLHQRWIQLSNAAAELEILNRPSLTEGAGPHPLFTGVRMITVTGLDTEPAIAKSEDQAVVQADGVQIKIRSPIVQVEKSTQTITLIPGSTISPQ